LIGVIFEKLDSNHHKKVTSLASRAERNLTFKTMGNLLINGDDEE
jgi:hypothetical protein